MKRRFDNCWDYLQRLGGPNEDSNLSNDGNPVVDSTPRSDSHSNTSHKSDGNTLNNNESNSESHTPPLPEKLKSPQQKRPSRFTNAPDEKDKTGGIKVIEKSKTDEKQNTKKPNEWDMFAEADNIGDFSVRCNIIGKYRFVIRFIILQSPTVEGKRQGGPDNPSLTDNWDDAEGYYR